MKTFPEDPTYETADEAAMGLQRQAQAGGLMEIAKLYGRFMHGRQRIESVVIGQVNLAREIGLKLQVVAGHEQLSMPFFQGIEARLPFDFEAAKSFVALARRAPEPVRTMEEARALITPMLMQLNLLEAPEREEPGAPSAVGTLSRWLNVITQSKQLFEKAESERPLQSWTPDELRTLLDDSEWVELKREEAKRLLELTAKGRK